MSPSFNKTYSLLASSTGYSRCHWETLLLCWIHWQKSNKSVPPIVLSLPLSASAVLEAKFLSVACTGPCASASGTVRPSHWPATGLWCFKVLHSTFATATTSLQYCPRLCLSKTVQDWARLLKTVWKAIQESNVQLMYNLRTFLRNSWALRMVSFLRLSKSLSFNELCPMRGSIIAYNCCSSCN